MGNLTYSLSLFLLLPSTRKRERRKARAGRERGEMELGGHVVLVLVGIRLGLDGV